MLGLLKLYLCCCVYLFVLFWFWLLWLGFVWYCVCVGFVDLVRWLLLLFCFVFVLVCFDLVLSVVLICYCCLLVVGTVRWVCCLFDLFNSVVSIYCFFVFAFIYLVIRCGGYLLSLNGWNLCYLWFTIVFGLFDLYVWLFVYWLGMVAAGCLFVCVLCLLFAWLICFGLGLMFVWWFCGLLSGDYWFVGFELLVCWLMSCLIACDCLCYWLFSVCVYFVLL